MNTKMQQIECPACHSTIFFSVNQLISGQSFSCSNCNCTVSLASSSKKVVEETLEKFESVKISHKTTK